MTAILRALPDASASSSVSSPESYSQYNAHGRKVGDPHNRRGVGSQREVPTVQVAADNSTAVVTGYQRYTVTSSGDVSGATGKYSRLVSLLQHFREEDGATSFADIGCNAGIMSLLARREGYRNVHALDHDPEYIGVLQRVVESVRVPNAGLLTAATFDFGDPLPLVDVSLCGALIHWVYCRTAHFANRMDLIFRYLFAATNKYLIIEWVDPADDTIRHFRSGSNPEGCRKNITHPVIGYNRAAFLYHAQIYGELRDSFSTKSTRTVYVFKRRPPPSITAAAAAPPVMADLNCSADGELSRLQWAELIRRPSVLVRLGDERLANFTAVPQRGVTSRIYVDHSNRLVLKASYPRVAALRREMCIYRTLNAHGVSWTPKMLCADNMFAMIMTHAGRPLTSANIPRDYRAQFDSMLHDMTLVGVEHNDLKHDARHLTVDSHGHWTYPKLELRVDGDRMVMLDFNMATINGSYSCRDRYGRNMERPRYHMLSPDARARVALDVLWNKSHTA